MYVFVRRQKKEIKNKKYFIIDPTLLGQGRHSVMINSVPSFFLVKRLCKRTWKAGANNLLFSILQCCGYFPSIFVFVGVQKGVYNLCDSSSTGQEDHDLSRKG